MVQRTLNFEVERLLESDRRLKRGSSVSRPRQMPPVDPHVTELSDIVRLTGQNDAILKRLRRGPATSLELLPLAVRYGARIKDLREYGFQISSERLAGGGWKYTLTGEPKARAS